MANTYHQLLIQTVFAVKYRDAQISNDIRRIMFPVMGNLFKENGCRIIIINGVEDHVHCLFGIKPDISISNVIQNVKAKSSKWVNENSLCKTRFEWQKGFGAFSYSNSQMEVVYRYIQNQENHHRKTTFREEYIKMLKKYNVDFDDKYLFEDLQ
ncbi:IS200/IS605 family transposase [Rhodonellum ikkaensis]|uniref:REP element-mobilizing transposase RayT n=2 Tax=Rhodonellum ikkaensis TaxID=336829 RepID=A0A1H3Q177_9BACT|nr:IS200/IS605 family transposase [Rhodonellum ikkaensis]SDZ06973.1 REP element-mobilizing transposase RayT [Rhodonellum ikkaensis]